MKKSIFIKLSLHAKLHKLLNSFDNNKEFLPFQKKEYLIRIKEKINDLITLSEEKLLLIKDVKKKKELLILKKHLLDLRKIIND